MSPTDELPYRTVRDLKKISQKVNRPLSEITFIDNDAYKYEGSDANIIIISSFEGDKDDPELMKLLELL